MNGQNKQHWPITLIAYYPLTWSILLIIYPSMALSALWNLQEFLLCEVPFFRICNLKIRVLILLQGCVRAAEQLGRPLFLVWAQCLQTQAGHSFGKLVWAFIFYFLSPITILTEGFVILFRNFAQAQTYYIIHNICYVSTRIDLYDQLLLFVKYLDLYIWYYNFQHIMNKCRPIQIIFV